MTKKLSPPGFGLVGADQRHVLTFLYPNLRGVLKTRRVEPRIVVWDKSQESSEPEWLLEAMDLNEREVRLFTMRDMREVARV